MKVYRLWYSDSHEGNVYTWFRTKREAEKEKRRLIKEWNDDECTPPDIGVVALPDTVKEMVNWLNDNLSRDNG